MFDVHPVRQLPARLVVTGDVFINPPDGSRWQVCARLYGPQDSENGTVSFTVRRWSADPARRARHVMTKTFDSGEELQLLGLKRRAS